MGRIENEIKEYNIQLRENNYDGDFMVSDIQECYELAKEKNGKINIFYLVDNALMSGYMRGYKKAKREQKK